MDKTPFYLQGNFGPVDDEVEAFDLKVEGEIPEYLEGMFLRNGPNPTRGDPGHWFFGDGMIHATRLEGGRASWYRNRYVDTASRRGAPAMQLTEDLKFDHTVGVSNTHVVSHAGKILALVESSYPAELDRELNTVGPLDFDGKLTTSFTAHPKVCAKTGEMLAFGYSALPPFLTYHRISPDGTLVQSEEIKVPGSTMMHDFSVTENHVVFMDLPIVFKAEQVTSGMPYQWDASYGARLGVMPRNGSNADVVWMEIEPCFVFHPMNAYERDGRIVMDVVRYPEFMSGGPLATEAGELWRWTIDLAAHIVKEEKLDDRATEFPRIDPRRECLENRYGYAVLNGSGKGLSFEGLVKHDLERGTSEVHNFGPGAAPSECVFVPAGPDAAEDEGVVMAYVYHEDTNASEFVVLDAQNFSKPALGRVALPQRVPFGFHGSWSPDPR